jgi:ketosteroid isomerase-like protein
MEGPSAYEPYFGPVGTENLETVARNYEIVNSIGRTDRGFVDPEEFAPDLWSRLSPDFELRERADLPDAKTYRGRDASKEFWRKTQELFAEVQWTPSELIDLGDIVVAVAKVKVVGRASDVTFEVDETDVFWFQGGLLVRLHAFPSKEEAFAALPHSF